MSFIKSEKIKYTYPVFEDYDEEEGALKEPKEPPKPAIDGIDLEVNQGDFICILGSNGSGKSTFAKHLNALLLPDEGTVWIDGMDSKDESKLWDIRAMVGMVFQNPDNQIIGSVVDEDVAFGLENLGVPSEEIQKRVYESINDVGMEKYAKWSPNKLSGGQKQRVAVAGIMAMKPKCIVLDESTAMLDPRGRKEVMDTAIRLNKEAGITIISITHYMDEALEADKIFVMSGSHVVMSGTPREVFSRYEEIESCGLKLPMISRLAYELKKSGLDIPDGILYEEELKEAILNLCKK